MIKTLFRLVLVVLLLVAVGSFYFGYRWGDPITEAPVRVERAVGTTGSAGIDTSRARETGAEIGEQVARGANKAQYALSEAALTAKIKSKMALDDTVKASRIDVDTSGTAVTLSGIVRTQAEKQRALQLAHETDGVTSVANRLRVEP